MNQNNRQYNSPVANDTFNTDEKGVPIFLTQNITKTDIDETMHNLTLHNQTLHN